MSGLGDLGLHILGRNTTSLVVDACSPPVLLVNLRLHPVNRCRTRTHTVRGSVGAWQRTGGTVGGTVCTSLSSESGFGLGSKSLSLHELQYK